MMVFEAICQKPHHHNPLRLFVGNVDFSIQDDNRLFAFFATWVEVAAFKFVRDEDGRSKGYGFLDVRSDDDVGRALELDGYDFHGRPLRVQRPREVT